MIGYIYCIQENNKPIYVGCTQNVSIRIKQHIEEATKAKHRQQPIHKYMHEKGLANFEFKILETREFAERAEMYELEKEYISKFDTYNNGLNWNAGGNTKGEGVKNPNARAIVCETTGEHFDCIQDACYKYGLGITEMSSHLTGQRYKNGIGKRKLGKALKFKYENRKRVG